MHSNNGDDFSLSRVPAGERVPMWKMLVVRLGALACVSQLMLGATLGYGMTFMDAFLATMVGSVLLQVVSWGIGAAACKEGMSTSLLSRWAGFGKIGSSIIGGVIALSLVGWFGVQNSVFAEGMHEVTGLLNIPVWALITGLAITVLVVFGIKMISRVANVFVPLFILAVLFAAYHMLQGHSIADLIASPAPGEALSFATATTMVAGGFMAGAVVTPDFARFMRSGKDVFWMTLIGTFVGELGMNLIAVLLAHAAATNNVVDIMMQLTGWLGACIVIFSTVKLNDINLYSSSLGLSTMVDALTGHRPNRAILTWILGGVGTVLSMVGIINHFVGFLSLLGVAIPPVAGIIIVDYYVLKRSRKILDETRESGEMPKTVEKVNPLALVSWVLAFLIGQFVTLGIPALNSLVGAGIIYFVIMKAYQAVTKKENTLFEQTDKVV